MEQPKILISTLHNQVHSSLQNIGNAPDTPLAPMCKYSSDYIAKLEQLVIDKINPSTLIQIRLDIVKGMQEQFNIEVHDTDNIVDAFAYVKDAPVEKPKQNKLVKALVQKQTSNQDVIVAPKVANKSITKKVKK